MKLQLNKKKLKNLSKDAQILPGNMTPNVAGGTGVAATCGGGWQDTYSGLTGGTNPPATDTCGGGSCGCDTSREECGTGRGNTNACA